MLRKLYPKHPHVEVSPEDAAKLGIRPDRWVVIESRRGQLQARAIVTPTVRAGQIFLPMHDEATNRLTDAVFDPYSRQPSYKSCAVRMRPAGRG